jgi:protein-tyrosine kinase
MASAQNPATSLDLVVIREPDSAGAQAYRSVRETLRHARSEAPLRSLLLADAGSDVRTGEAAANIAASFALSGEPTVLVDLDAAHPVAHQLTGAQSSPGLIDWLAAERDAADKRPAPLSSGIDQLAVIPAGDRHQSATRASLADLLTDDRCRALIESLSSQYRYIIFHGSASPVTSQLLTVAANVDAAALIVRSGTTKRTAAQQAKESLERVGAHLLGAILTEE